MGNPVRGIARGLTRPGAAVAFSLAVKVAEFVLLAPLGAAVLRAFLERWGRASVGNFEIAAFLLSPPGVLALVAAAGLVLATLYLEVAGLMRLQADRHLGWGRGLAAAAFGFPKLVALGVVQAAAYLILALPFLAGVGLAYVAFWSGRDPNSLLVLRPPQFWLGAGVAAVLVAGYAVLAGRLFFRWLFALPILLFEPGVSVSGALRRSAERTRGRAWSLVGAIAAWTAVMTVLHAVVLGGIGGVAGWLLDRVGTSPAVAVPATAAVLLAELAAVTLLSVAGTVTFAAVVLARYEEATGHSTVPAVPVPAAAVRYRRLVLPILLGLAAVVTWQSIALIRGVRLADGVEITAHRAGATHAPENTVAALRRAIADGADWAEIDVMLTADDALVVTHDTDLSRSGGGTRRVRDATLADIRALDVGGKFGPAFAGEKIPTFDEMLSAAGDRIRLNVELKPHGAAGAVPLTDKVVAAIRAAGMVERCRICSQSYESLQRSRELEPRLAVGVHRRGGAWRFDDLERRFSDGRGPEGDPAVGRPGRRPGDGRPRLDGGRPGRPGPADRPRCDERDYRRHPGDGDPTGGDSRVGPSRAGRPAGAERARGVTAKMPDTETGGGHEPEGHRRLVNFVRGGGGGRTHDRHGRGRQEERGRRQGGAGGRAGGRTSGRTAT